MDLTKKLQALDTSLVVHNEGEWSNSTSTFTAFNSGGIECETGEFLYGLIRLLKCDRVLETGTHYAIGASYMGMALKDNGGGTLDTHEFLPEIYNIAQERINRMGLQMFVNCHFGDVKDVKPASKYQLMLLDTEPQTRFQEFLQFYPHLDEGGFLFIHDLHRHMHQIPNEEHGFAWPYGKIPDEMADLIRTGKMRPFHFSTPRGLTGFYKVSAKDYTW